jgi:hypothetical protein
MMRLRALWFDSQLVMGISWFIFAVNLVTYIGVFIYMYATATFIPATSPFTGCQFIPTFGYTYVALITSLMFETCIVILTVVKTYPQARQQAGNPRRLIAPLLFSDGLIYYLTIIVVQIVTLFLKYLAETSISLPVLVSSPCLAVVAISCNRLFIRLQKNLRNRSDTVFESATLTLPTMEVNCDKFVAVGQGGRWRVRPPLSVDFSSLEFSEMGDGDIEKLTKSDVS